ncbi:biotin--[acetyl-CoA-carboxylase] ligase [Psychroflexus sediminis]|uniref:BirA family transcriptional regulator, biotin operon repressor / biotin-[acetyl-CoA-carboxylase] ligase n=1 Tax=Psychroflexus sediminis TaxID=470826 RepID=A0A1G7V5D2_9FLAO|nr:biotin--[acetyl-CoA-carboxylase] ligase [Psychroflexus sediminis]SDG54974.1 BirA family transcriptional regulator, biotin operon repressor / biotin-[acetyl-CoA-carboxylase] ligase [Psychroflexus sediminis]
MKVVKVDAISSTNSFLKAFVKTHSEKQMYCVVAHHQVAGRGQRGTAWESEAGKNLTFSVYLPGLKSIHKETFKLSALVALAVKKVLTVYDMPKLAIKWPNDILSRQYKIGGILIENIFTQGREGASIVGIGLNVNQTSFSNLPKASSMRILSGNSFNLEALLDDILVEFEKLPALFNESSYRQVISEYYAALYKYNKVTMLQFPDGSLAQGLIRGVDSYGRLSVEFEEDRLEAFDIKEIQIKFSE